MVDSTSAPSAPSVPPPAERLFAIGFSPGPGWLAGRPMREQPLGPHGRYIAALLREGRLLLAGPYLDERAGGIAFVRAADQAAAEAIVRADPAVQAGVFVAEVRPWHAAVREAAPIAPAPAR